DRIQGRRRATAPVRTGARQRSSPRPGRPQTPGARRRAQRGRGHPRRTAGGPEDGRRRSPEEPAALGEHPLSQAPAGHPDVREQDARHDDRPPAPGARQRARVPGRRRTAL
ncbi:MAG: hypothetical protein AVDCRST_MAG53-2607, partial [uncultured Solirubrobacteraceae bacterium]